MLRDPAPVKRGAQAIAWHPDGLGKLAVAYNVLEFQRQPEGMPAQSYVWDVANPNAPEATLAPLVPLVSVAYNLKDQNIIGGGQYNGQFCFFDLRKSAAPVDTTPVEHSHRDPVHDFAWTQSKTGTELMSCSTDGSVLWWDLRKLAAPLEMLVGAAGAGAGLGARSGPRESRAGAGVGRGMGVVHAEWQRGAALNAFGQSRRRTEAAAGCLMLLHPCPPCCCCRC